MNSIRQTQALNKLELENAIPPSASWHADYRDTAYIYVGGLPFDVSEGDIVTIFSQFGNPTHVNLIRDKETGKSKGFAFLKYEDQRSCDLAVDNLGGAEVLGRVLRVDHTRYKKRDGEDEEAYRVDGREEEVGIPSEDEDRRERKKKKQRPMIKEEIELEQLLQIKEGEEEDPMREYLIKEKRHEVEQALVKLEKKERKHKHQHRHHHGDEEERTYRRRVGEAESEHRSHRHRDRQDGLGDRSHRRRTSVSSDERPKSREQRSRDHEDREGERRHERGRRD
jgi:RNA-binding motif protein, X-linked 2